jgi:hypothetical protein
VPARIVHHVHQGQEASDLAPAEAEASADHVPVVAAASAAAVADSAARGLAVVAADSRHADQAVLREPADAIAARTSVPRLLRDA